MVEPCRKAIWAADQYKENGEIEVHRQVDKVMLKYRIAILVLTVAPLFNGFAEMAGSRKIGSPIVTYWAGPGYPGSKPLTDASAQQLIEGGWNLAWCNQGELEIASRHGLRGLLTDPLLAPSTLDDPSKRSALDALIEKVKGNEWLYGYYLADEPDVSKFKALGKLVAYLREKDPQHVAFINLFPTYATNEQLGVRGSTELAYKQYLKQFIDVVKPSIISYDHYQLAANSDNPDFFLNLALVRKACLEARLPFLSTVQACTWTPEMRAPQEAEMRFLVYTTLAYGAQGISYYVYYFPGHKPGIVDQNNRPTEVYQWLSKLNREFFAIAKEVQSLRSYGVYHAGSMPPGAVALHSGAEFRAVPSVHGSSYKVGQRVKGLLLGMFGPTGGPALSADHTIVVNLDYETPCDINVEGKAELDAFDATEGVWHPLGERIAHLHLLPGEGRLLRFSQAASK